MFTDESNLMKSLCALIHFDRIYASNGSKDRQCDAYNTIVTLEEMGWKWSSSFEGIT